MTPHAARRAGLAAGGAALVAGALTLNRNLVGVFYDDGLYAGIAWALGHGLGYVHPHLPGTPAAVHFPPFYPLLLTPLFATLPTAGAALVGKALNVLLTAAASGLIAWHATRRELLGPEAPPWLATAVVAAASGAVPVLTVLTSLLSEPLFGVLLAAAVILADETPAASGGSVRLAAFAGLAAALALLTRSIGVAAGAGIVLFLVVVRRANRNTVLIAALPVALAALGWGLWVVGHRSGIDPAIAAGYGTYGDVLRQTGLSALPSSIRDLPRPLAVLTLGWVPSYAVYYLLGVPAVAVGVYGLIVLQRRSAIGATLAAYLAILAVWPAPPDRFLWAVLPWLALTWVAGVLAASRHARLRAPAAVLAVALGLGYAHYEARGFAGRWWAVSAARISDTFADLLPWVETLPPPAVVATDGEALIWLYGGRRAVPLYLFSYHGTGEARATPAEQLAFWERAGVTHVLLTGPGGSAAEVDALLGAAPGRLTMVRRWPGGRVAFEVARDR